MELAAYLRVTDRHARRVLRDWVEGRHWVVAGACGSERSYSAEIGRFRYLMEHRDAFVRNS